MNRLNVEQLNLVVRPADQHEAIAQQVCERGRATNDGGGGAVDAAQLPAASRAVIEERGVFLTARPLKVAVSGKAPD